MTLYKDLDMGTLCCSIKHPYSEVLFYTEILYKAGRSPRIGPPPHTNREGLAHRELP